MTRNTTDDAAPEGTADNTNTNTNTIPIEAGYISHTVNNFGDEDVEALRTALRNALTLKQDLLVITVNSGGGSVHNGLAMLDILHAYNQDLSIIMKAEGLVASMGAFLLVAGSDTRVCSPNTTFMLHEVSHAIMGTNAHIKATAQHTDYLNKRLDKLLIDAVHTTAPEPLTQELLEERIRHEQDWYLTAEDALRMGLVDAVGYFREHVVQQIEIKQSLSLVDMHTGRAIANFEEAEDAGDTPTEENPKEGG